MPEYRTPLPGILAVILHGTGMLAKFYAEAIEDVGGYINTALDLCFNALGAVLAMVLVRVFARPA